MEFAREVVGPMPNEETSNMSERQRNLRRIFSVCFRLYNLQNQNVVKRFLIVYTFLIKGAIGALDGTLIHAVVPVDQQTRYRGRGRGECYQNILAICDFNMVFTYVWAGWEGIAHDARVLREVASNPTSGFPFPTPGI